MQNCFFIVHVKLFIDFFIYYFINCHTAFLLAWVAANYTLFLSVKNKLNKNTEAEIAPNLGTIKEQLRLNFF